MKARLYIVGVGTGDSEYISLKAARILGEVKNIFFIQKPQNKSLALTIAKEHINNEAKLFPFNMVMKINRKRANEIYDKMAKEILSRLKYGEDVAYICEGDALFYGSANYLLERLKKRAKIEIIPAISSPFAAAASLLFPLGRSDEIFKILPATLKDEIILKELERAQIFAIIKIGKHIGRIKKLLAQAACLSNAKIVEYASCENEKITNLSDYRGDELPYFSIILGAKIARDNE